MAPSEVLAVVAQVAVTLAGFAGIVVVFRPGGLDEWSAVERFRLRLLLVNSALPLVLALFGLLLLTIEPPVPEIWRWCSGAAFLAQFVFGVMTQSMAKISGAAVVDPVSKLLYWSMAALGTAALLLQLVNVVWLGKFWPLFAGMFVHLLAAVLQFVRMILLPPHQR
jgi:energy-converting hydrogenase Eha subunit E